MKSFARLTLTTAILCAASVAQACVVEIPFSAYTDLSSPTKVLDQRIQNKEACEKSIDTILELMQKQVDTVPEEERNFINIEKVNTNTEAGHANEDFGVCKAGILHPLNYYVEFGIKDDRGENQAMASAVDFCMVVEQQAAQLHLDSDPTHRTTPSENQAIYKIDRIDNTLQSTDVNKSNSGQ